MGTKTAALPRFAERLAARRLATGMTQREVDIAAGYRSPTYAHYEGGRREPKIATLARFADALGCSLADILT